MIRYMSTIKKYLQLRKDINLYDPSQWVDTWLGSLSMDNFQWLLDTGRAALEEDKVVFPDSRKYDDKNTLISSTYNDWMKAVQRADEDMAQKYRIFHPLFDEVITYMRTNKVNLHKRYTLSEVKAFVDGMEKKTTQGI